MDSGFARVGSAGSRRHSTCLGEESESPRLDKKRGPRKFSELLLGLLPRPGDKIIHISGVASKQVAAV